MSLAQAWRQLCIAEINDQLLLGVSEVEREAGRKLEGGRATVGSSIRGMEGMVVELGRYGVGGGVVEGWIEFGNEGEVGVEWELRSAFEEVGMEAAITYLFINYL